ncbi:hypothetical protein ACWF94_07200 [Streptomyces sp. NPDC055078]
MARSRTFIATALILVTGAAATACTSGGSPSGTPEDITTARARVTAEPSQSRSADTPSGPVGTPSATPGTASSGTTSSGTASTAGAQPPRADKGRKAPSEPASGGGSGAERGAAKNDVTVQRLIPKPGGQALWVPVSIHNHGPEAAGYTAVIRITGSNGFTATVRATTGALPPGRTASQSHTAQDSSGTAVPSDPEAVVIDVVRTPA